MKILITYLIATLICMSVGIIRLRQRSDLAARQGGWLVVTCYLWPFWAVFYAIDLSRAVLGNRHKKQGDAPLSTDLGHMLLNTEDSLAEAK
ncbi:hypothetical protein VR010_10150 [Actinomycetaceae bacterium L2_0104]